MVQAGGAAHLRADGARQQHVPARTYHPAPACPLEHWYALRGPPQALDSEQQRFTALIALTRRARRAGLSAVKADILAACAGEGPFDLAFLPLAGAVFQCDPPNDVVQFLLRHLHNGTTAQQVAATYGAAFFLSLRRDLLLLLTERSFLEQEGSPVTLAAREVLGVYADVQHGATCTRCGRIGRLPGVPSAEDLQVHWGGTGLTF